MSKKTENLQKKTVSLILKNPKEGKETKIRLHLFNIVVLSSKAFIKFEICVTTGRLYYIILFVHQM